MSRPDQSITFLRQFGYSVFRVPRLSAQPLDLLHRNGKDLTRLGSPLDLMVPGAVPLPPVHRDDRPGVAIEGTQSSKVNVAIGLNLLGGFIGAVGGGTLGLQAGFKKAKTVTFTYAAVTEDRIDVLALERFIKAGTISPHVPSGTIDKLIDDEVYVITSVLKSQKIAVAAQSESGQNVALDVPVIQQAVGGSLKVTNEGTVSAIIAFEGPVAIPFAFQAVKLVFDESAQFLTTDQLPAGEAAARAVRKADAGRPAFLQAQGAFVRMS